MKKLLFLLFIVPMALEVSAQAFPEGTTSAYFAPNPNSNVKYRGSVDASIRFGNSGIGRYGFTSTHGLAFGDYASVGLGAGLYYYTQRYYKETTQFTFFLRGETNFVNPKDKKVVPYIGANIGLSSINSFFVEPAVGVKFPFKDGKRALKVAVGYTYERYNGGLDKMWQPVPGSGEVVVDPDTGESAPVDGGYVVLDDVRSHLSGVVFTIGFQF